MTLPLSAECMCNMETPSTSEFYPKPAGVEGRGL